MVTTLHLMSQQTYSAGMCEAEGKELYFMGTDFLVRKLDQLTVGKPRKEGKSTNNE